MVSPHSEWEDHDWGYRNEVSDSISTEEVDIFVRPVFAKYGQHGSHTRTVPRGDENSYSVVVERGYQAHDEIVTFKDERVAWEFAHLLTHYFVHKIGTPMAAVGDLMYDPGGLAPEEQWTPDRIIDDFGASQVLEKMHFPNKLPDEVAEVLE